VLTFEEPVTTRDIEKGIFTNWLPPGLSPTPSQWERMIFFETEKLNMWPPTDSRKSKALLSKGGLSIRSKIERHDSRWPRSVQLFLQGKDAKKDWLRLYHWILGREVWYHWTMRYPMISDTFNKELNRRLIWISLPDIELAKSVWISKENWKS